MLGGCLGDNCPDLVYLENEIDGEGLHKPAP